MVKSKLRAGLIEIRTLPTVSHIRPIRPILSAEAIVAAERRMTERKTSTYWIHKLLDVIGIISEIDPWFSVSCFAQGIVDRGDALRRIQVRYIPAEIREIIAAYVRIPVQFLPCAGGIVEWTADLKYVSEGLVNSFDTTHLEKQLPGQNLDRLRSPCQKPPSFCVLVPRRQC